jgi:hypothetical protein
MHIRTALTLAVIGCALTGAASLPAVAGTGHRAASPASTKAFHSTISPKKIHTGQKFTIKGHGAKKSTSYACIQIVVKGSKHGYDINSVKFVTSTTSGAVTCRSTFKAFHTTVAGKSRHCPLTKTDKKAGYKCGVAVSTTTQSSTTAAYFTSTKK